jgi:uncharacterized repeat protein (TIGR03833 family)
MFAYVRVHYTIMPQRYLALRECNMDGTKRADITRGLRVAIVLKSDQRSGNLTEGIVAEILTKSPTHPHGIKVKLESGAVGRVKTVLP